MPYPNEHSARLRDPKEFKEQPSWAKKGQKFARTTDGKIFGKIKVPTTVGVIWGQLKSQTGKAAAPQSLRFPTKNWTADKARKWLKDNNVKHKRFEAAKPKEKQSMSNDTAPLNACIFNENVEVIFADSAGEGKSGFKIVGYSGGILERHWFWGNVAFDLSGLKFAKRRTPVLEEHFRQNRVGFTTKQEIKDNVTVEGQFLDNDFAQRLKGDMQKGFPMEASLFCPPTIVEHVKEGEKTKVNGHILKGPGAVFRKASIKEVSMCVFGADSNTKSSAYADYDKQEIKFNSIQENNIMGKDTEGIITDLLLQSVEDFAAQFPELHAELLTKGKEEGFAEGEKSQHDLFSALKEACGGDNELLIQCYSEGKTIDEATQLHVAKLETEKTQLTEKVTDLQKSKPGVDPAVIAFTDGATKPGEETEGDEEAWRKEFAESSELKTEFGNDVEAYVFFKKSDAEGKVQIAGNV